MFSKKSQFHVTGRKSSLRAWDNIITVVETILQKKLVYSLF